MSAISIDHLRTSASSPQRSALVERVNRLYHEWTAGRFDNDHQARHRIEAEFWRWIGRTVLMNPTERAERRLVLDIACGSGFVLQALAPFLSADDAFMGVDLSAASLNHARAKAQSGDGSRNTFWVGSSGTQLPMADDSVSLVTINASLHHFANPARMLAEADRVLMPDGHLAIGFEPNARYFQASWLPCVGAGLDRLRWYASLDQNRQRIRQLRNTLRTEQTASTELCTDEIIASRIARRLVEDGSCREQLPAAAILDLVDVHSRGEAKGRGLNLEQLFSTSLIGYEIRHVFTSDYLGASPRMMPVFRRAADGIGRWVSPRSGSLISCLLRKPKETP